MIKTGDRTYCVIAEWSEMDALTSARTQMIATLNVGGSGIGAGGSCAQVANDIRGRVAARRSRCLKRGLEDSSFRKSTALEPQLQVTGGI
jgi:hypothetical protein